MLIKLIVVSKTDIPYLQTGIDDYVRRLNHYTHFQIDVIPALKEVRDSDEVRQREGQLILKHLAGCDRVILLDERGVQRSSVDFSKYLQKQMNAGLRTVAFVVGGAFGFSPAVYAAAHDKISLSAMTFNHQMVRLFFVEQLYRAFTILHGEKYHNE